MSSFLKLQDIVIQYGPIVAIKGINIEVPEGKIISLLGANGAGKSTIMKAITGVISVQSGVLSFLGKPIHHLKTYQRAALGIITSPEGRLVFKDLTVEENLRIGAYALKKKPEDGNRSIKMIVAENFLRVYQYFPILAERRKQKASTLSGGEQQMLAIGRALMARPKLLLLDEPSLGLAPLIVKQIFQIIQAIAKEGTTILIVEQNAYQTLKISDYSYLLELGKIKAEGTPNQLLAQNTLLTAYLGGQ